MKSKISKSILALAATAGVVALIAIVAASTSGGGGTASSPGASSGGDVAHTAPHAQRTVFVSWGHEPPPSRPGSLLRALRLSGFVPSRPTVGTVLTDEDCAPDARGVSHCINRIRFADGRTLSVRHPHRMMDVPCLTPGEHVKVRRA